MNTKKMIEKMTDAKLLAKQMMSNDPAYYHTIFHVEDMLKRLEEMKKNAIVTDIEHFLLYMAICFHDIVYEPWEGENEKKSAELFKEKYKDDEDASEFLDKVYSLIMSTRVIFGVDLNTHTDDKLEQIIHTLDWNAFADEKKFKENRIKIFCEAMSKKYKPLTICERQLQFWYIVLDNLKKDYKIDYFNEENNKKAIEVLQRATEEHNW